MFDKDQLFVNIFHKLLESSLCNWSLSSDLVTNFIYFSSFLILSLTPHKDLSSEIIVFLYLIAYHSEMRWKISNEYPYDSFLSYASNKQFFNNRKSLSRGAG